MELSGHDQEAEIPMPLNSAYVGASLHDHAHHIHSHTNHHIDHPPSSSHMITIPIPPQNPPNTNNNTSNGTSSNLEDHHHPMEGYNGNYMLQKKVIMIRYRECHKNHAASMGGNATTDGCGEFMPSGEEGSIEALTCSACNCHRNFHRKEVEGEPHLIIPPPTNSHFHPSTPHPNLLNARGRKVILGGPPVNMPFTTRATVMPINMAYKVGTVGGQSSDDHSDDHDHHHHGNGGVMIMRPHDYNSGNHHQLVKKRFRTKFSQEQKEKMLDFAEKVGWKIQKQEESVVQQFCQEIGVKRRVLKVWMHNNKHNFGNKDNTNSNMDNNNNNMSPSTI